MSPAERAARVVYSRFSRTNPGLDLRFWEESLWKAEIGNPKGCWIGYSAPKVRALRGRQAMTREPFSPGVPSGEPCWAVLCPTGRVCRAGNCHAGQ